MAAPKRYIPLGDGVLVKMNPAKEEDGGIHIPDAHRRKEVIGRVAEVGPKVRDLTIGDVVLVPEFGHHVINIDGVRHLLMDEDTVICIMDAQ